MIDEVVRAPAQLQDVEGLEADLIEMVRKCHHDPLRFVLLAYPWREPGTFLEHHDGPDKWQIQFLKDVGAEVKKRHFDGHTPVMPVLKAASKGHGVGGSVMCAWMVDWIMSTRPNAQGVVTANTNTQLETKTWAAIRRWTSMCLTGHWFTVNSARMYHPAFPESWFCTPQTCREENSEAFAGQHAADSSSFYVFDEDSSIPEVIHEVSEGGCTDGEPFIFRFGNATRNTGSFHKCCFGSSRDRWHPVIVDSRESRFSNKELIQAWIDEHGEDSDFVRVRVRGLPPRASDAQFIDMERIWDAQKREVMSFDDEPLVCGVDFSGGGSAWNVVRFRRGMDGRTLPPVRIAGEKTRNDRSMFLAVLAGILQERAAGKRVAMMFCDSAFGAPYVERLKSMGFANVLEVNFGGDSPDPKHQANFRAFMWLKTKEWLTLGAIDPADIRLEGDLSAPGFHLDRRDRLVLESKESMQKRAVASPDDGDALALTFAAPVVKAFKDKAKPQKRKTFAGRRGAPGGPAGLGWMK